MKSSHLHKAEGGCEVEEIREFKNYKYRTIGAYCKTHQIEVCRCGWEKGWHYGTYSAILVGSSGKIIRPLTIPYEEPSKGQTDTPESP